MATRNERGALLDSGVIKADFDINGLENLLPTKRHRNRQKTNYTSSDQSIIYYMELARQKSEKAKRLFDSANAGDRSLKSYLQLKVQAEKNDIDVEDMFSFLHHQSEGEVPLRVSPEIVGAPVVRANSEFATILMDKPFALGGCAIDGVNLYDDSGNLTMCTTANEFINAKSKGPHPRTQFDITCYGLADQTSELLRSVKSSFYAASSEIRSPLITLTSVDKRSSEWARDCFVGREHAPDLSKLNTLASLIGAGLLRIDKQSPWELIVVAQSDGLGVQLRELCVRIWMETRKKKFWSLV